MASFTLSPVSPVHYDNKIGVRYHVLSFGCTDSDDVPTFALNISRFSFIRRSKADENEKMCFRSRTVISSSLNQAINTFILITVTDRPHEADVTAEPSHAVYSPSQSFYSRVNWNSQSSCTNMKRTLLPLLVLACIATLYVFVPHSNDEAIQDLMYDYIILGAGAAGCALTARLAEKTRGASILLLEAGNANWEDPNLVQTTAYTGSNNFFENNTAPSNDARYSWPTFLQPDASLFKTRNLIGSGKGFGGSASLNAGMLIFGSSHVWNQYWPSSWSYGNIKPYFGSLAGWIKPYWSSTRYAPTNTFLQAAQNIASRQRSTGDDFLVNRATRGVESIETPGQPGSVNYNDVEGVNSVTAFGQYQITQQEINSTYFKRVYGADLFNETVVDRSTGKGKGAFTGLQIITEANVKRVTFRTSRWSKPQATGVEFIRNGILYTASARREIVITAGTFQSPAILQRSGVGSFDRLKVIGVKTLIYDNPLVGANFRNHYSPQSSVNGYGDSTQLKEFFSQFVSNFPGYPFLRGGAFLGWHKLDPNRPAVVTNSSPRKYQIFFAAGQTTVDARAANDYGISSLASTSLSITPDNIHFESYGKVEIAHPSDPSVIPNMFYTVLPSYTFNASKTVASQLPLAQKAEPNTISSLLGYDAIYQLVDEMNQVLKSQGKNITLSYGMPRNDDLKTFHEGLQRLGADWWKLIWTWALPSNASAQDIAFQKACSAILYVIRTAAHLDSHQNGSNKIGDVVDDRLNVKGVEGLRVADLSVAAVPPGGNTQATAYVIGARAADLIIADNY
ncbi:hypothetical protein PROFUN_03512 [Planoprotostelium fungivorum]|uniref:Glucose-methanol-choline oxidoreductase N-terminal domain-containing protein n=1 Tax=Planoprotostelium fungivorum TaxID=1890364 RepID=A0A2P6MNB3_9EUKA|nr:hypothetical protein PROFUN_03512 [Planoprotostelium fungivorum]